MKQLSSRQLSQLKYRRSQKGKQAAKRYDDKRRKTPHYRVEAMYREMRRRTNGHYKNVKLQITHDAFVKWALPQVEAFLATNPNGTPSVDRIDPKGHYELSNLRIIDYLDNIARGQRMASFLRFHGGLEESLPRIKLLLRGIFDTLGCSYEEGLNAIIALSRSPALPDEE